MNKHLLITLICTSFLSIRCTSEHQNKNDDKMTASDYEVKLYETEETRIEEAEINRVLQQRSNRLNSTSVLTLISSKTVYNDDFKPTVTFTVKNTSVSTITAFELKADEQVSYTKRIKAKLLPDQTYSASIQLHELEGLSGNIPISVNKIIFSDGQMVETTSPSFEHVY